MSEFKKPSASDTMIDHAEQHSLVVDEFEKLWEKIDDLQQQIIDLQ